ncbi:MAG: hypothetical protein HYY16_19740 [Planctomycetes bacterium]|nr:hypothetical protein [Planctomycetota bacterium]
MAETSAAETNFNELALWLERAARNAPKCFICLRISQVNRLGTTDMKTVRISGIDLSAEVQITHLARCVGKSGHAEAGESRDVGRP